MQIEAAQTTNGKKKEHQKRKNQKLQTKKSEGNLFTNIWRKNVRWDTNKKNYIQALVIYYI